MGKEIGNTPLVELKNITRGCAARLFAKVEGENLGGSIKDRVAQAILDDAEARGAIQKGGAVIEATSGNTGIGLALCCRLRGYQAKIVMPDTMSVERREMIEKQGGEVILTDGKKGMSGAIEKALALLEETPNAVYADQFNNPVCWKAHYESTGPEIWAQTQGKIDILVACVGTGGTITGVGKYLKERDKNIRVVAVEPSASPLLSKGYAGPHKIQGIGANFLPQVLDCAVYDEVITVTDQEAFDVARRLKTDEKLSVGISSGAAVAAALKAVERFENAGKNIVVILPDSGDRYESIL
jgi:cysteine synthase A